ncbi:VWA domain-containing protein [Hymenobacter sp. J193]|uniref:vWA domain-containing protein n=1 Tax=Hymenobacter sp. J193 TaxID=2898429 RepID=UPI002150BDE1|nr:vWA domain-containing protein [Hymenobacter sp. J193]MCR5888325.1 VWA domain-containing protein [Hymenobacter sp. J193]
MSQQTPLSTVYNLLILDESGSMEVVREATIRGFNELVQSVQGLARELPDKKQVVNLTTFNGAGIREKLFLQEASALHPLTLADYRPDSMTPLHDAIGQSVTKLRNVLTTTGATDYQVLVTVLTDGEENASKEFTRPVIRQLIEQLKDQGWTFTYIGANHDVEQAAGALAIDNKLSFNQNEAAMEVMFARERVARRSYNLKSKDELLAGRFKADYFDDDEPARPTPAADEPRT